MIYLRHILPLLSVLAVLAAGPAPARQTAAPQVIAQARADFDRDGREETLEVVLLQGRRFNDSEPWCGEGDKWQGRFALRVRRGGKLLDQRPWAELFYRGEPPEEPDFFWAPLELVVADYNGDGRPDFNLGVYGSCNGNLYRLFTLSPSGRLAELPVMGGRALAVSGAGQRNSTPLIRVEDGALTHTYYDNTQGKEITTRYQWRDGCFAPLALQP